MKTKCNKCDEQGMIREKKNGTIYGHSCKCGKYSRLINERFEKMMGNPTEALENLLTYGRKRVEEKKRLTN